ncbi:MAG: hypothetical protein K940chlam9_00903 [Chlamydiae bacterium]|nr:hypothetical protein [Chlamydiota bacterium]
MGDSSLGVGKTDSSLHAPLTRMERLQVKVEKMPKWATVGLLVGGVALATLAILGSTGTLRLPFMQHMGNSAKTLQDGTIIAGGAIALTGAGLTIEKIILWVSDREKMREAGIDPNEKFESIQINEQDGKLYLENEEVTIQLEQEDAQKFTEIKNLLISQEWNGALALMEQYPEIKSIQIGKTKFSRWEQTIKGIAGETVRKVITFERLKKTE